MDVYRRSRDGHSHGRFGTFVYVSVRTQAHYARFKENAQKRLSGNTPIYEMILHKIIGT